MAEHEIWTPLKLLAWTKDFLSSKGVVNARLEAEWLLCAATGLDRVGLYLHYDKPLNDGELADYRALVTRRARREPLQHILGTQEFFGLEYEVSADVLVPRYDTEVLVTEALTLHPQAKSVLDVGTGSGCIAIALKKRLIQADVTAIDISEAALTIARRNATRHDCTVEYLLGSLFLPVAGRCFDIIVSNPPYIPSADIESLEQEVRDYDPRSALDGGRDGLDIYRKMIPDACEHLNPCGWLLVEIGSGQAHDIIQMFTQGGCYEKPLIALDPGGIERVISAQRKEHV